MPRLARSTRFGKEFTILLFGVSNVGATTRGVVSVTVLFDSLAFLLVAAHVVCVRLQDLVKGIDASVVVAKMRAVDAILFVQDDETNFGVLVIEQAVEPQFHCDVLWLLQIVGPRITAHGMVRVGVRRVVARLLDAVIDVAVEGPSLFAALLDLLLDKVSKWCVMPVGGRTPSPVSLMPFSEVMSISRGQQRSMIKSLDSSFVFSILQKLRSICVAVMPKKSM